MTKSTTPPANDISVRLKILRAENGFTQAEVAAKLGISQQMYSKYEGGSTVPDADMVKQICGIYGISADYLLGIAQERKSSVKTTGANEENIDLIVEKVISRMNKRK